MRNIATTTRTLSAAIVLVALLGSTTPAFAARSSAAERISGRQDVVRIVKRIVSRIFGGITANETITSPRPSAND